MENEEIRGLMHKMVYPDQFMGFVKFKFWDLSLFSVYVSLSWSLRVFLEHSSLEQGKGKESKEQGKENNIKQI